jgi:hypothetical protein
MLAHAEEIEDLNRPAQRAGTLDTIRNLLEVSKSAQSSPAQSEANRTNAEKGARPSGGSTSRCHCDAKRPQRHA